MMFGWRRDATSSGRGEGETERLRRVLRRVWTAYRRQRVEYRRQRQGWAEERAALQQRVTEGEEQVRQLRATVGQHVRARFGRRTEQKEKAGGDAGKGRARGQRRGAKGHGRQRNRYEGLPIVDVADDVPEQGKWCEKCGAPRIEVAEDVSDELDVERAIRFAGRLGTVLAVALERGAIGSPCRSGGPPCRRCAHRNGTGGAPRQGGSLRHRTAGGPQRRPGGRSAGALPLR